MIFIKDSFKFKICYIAAMGEEMLYEYSAVVMCDYRTVIFTFSRSPSNDILFINKLYGVFTALNGLNYTVILTSDFNITFLSTANMCVQCKKLILSFGWSVAITHPSYTGVAGIGNILTSLDPNKSVQLWTIVVYTVDISLDAEFNTFLEHLLWTLNEAVNLKTKPKSNSNCSKSWYSVTLNEMKQSQDKLYFLLRNCNSDQTKYLELKRQYWTEIEINLDTMLL